MNEMKCKHPLALSIVQKIAGDTASILHTRNDLGITDYGYVAYAIGYALGGFGMHLDYVGMHRWEVLFPYFSLAVICAWWIGASDGKEDSNG